MKRYEVYVGDEKISEHDTKSEATLAMYAAWYAIDGLEHVFVVDSYTGLGVNWLHRKTGVN